MPFDIEADAICTHCHEEFWKHNYVANSIDEYQCPRLCHETKYGYFTGGDPRDFHPDAQDCSKAELSNHRRACELWNDAPEGGLTPEACPSGWVYDASGKPIYHVLRAPYGIGTQTYTFQTTFEEIERDYDESLDP